MTPSTQWQRCLERVAEQVGNDAFATWFQSVDCSYTHGNTVTLHVPNRFFKESIETRYLPTLEGIIAEEFNLPSVIVDWNIRSTDEQPAAPAPPVHPETSAADLRKKALSAGLDSRYHFSNFVTGASNQFAQAACRAVADEPGRTYNPLLSTVA